MYPDNTLTKTTFPDINLTDDMEICFLRIFS